MNRYIQMYQHEKRIYSTGRLKWINSLISFGSCDKLKFVVTVVGHRLIGSRRQLVGVEFLESVWQNRTELKLVNLCSRTRYFCFD